MNGNILGAQKLWEKYPLERYTSRGEWYGADVMVSMLLPT